MTRRVRFTKMQGLGNDFVVFDGVREKIDLERPPALDPLIDTLCSMRQSSFRG